MANIRAIIFLSIIIATSLVVMAQPFTPSELGWFRGAATRMQTNNPPPLLPPDSTNIVEWLDASTLQIGFSVTNWHARVGADASTNVAQTGISPLVISDIDGKNTVAFNILSGLATTNFPAGNQFQPWSVGMVFTYLGPSNNEPILTDVPNQADILEANMSGPQIGWYTSMGIANRFGALDQNRHVFFVTYNGTSTLYGWDGGSLTNFENGTAGGNAIESCFLFNRFDTFNGLSSGNINEIIIWHGDEIANYNAYLQYVGMKW